jgi:FMN-dependent NADH-azoreductase
MDSLGGTIVETKPAEVVKPISDEDFLKFRDEASMKMDFSDEAFRPAISFAQADEIVIAAPYWDMSFPAILKAYFEQINVIGLTFKYSEEGIPIGLCNAKRLIYVTTAGGPVFSDEYGYGYVKALAQGFYGIKEVCEVKAECLDVIGADVEGILEKAFSEWQNRQ